MKTNQLLRLLWIDAFAREYGRINRSDICAAWELSLAQAGKDLTYLADKYPRRYRYDIREKCYVWTETKRFLNPVRAFPLIERLNQYID